MIKKKHQLFILALVFVGTLLSSFHYHDDMHAEEDCSVCIIQQVFSVADIPEPVTLQELIVFLLIPLLGRQTYFSLKLIRSCPSRAPPSFS